MTRSKINLNQKETFVFSVDDLVLSFCGAAQHTLIHAMSWEKLNFPDADAFPSMSPVAAPQASMPNQPGKIIYVGKIPT